MATPGTFHSAIASAASASSSGVIAAMVVSLVAGGMDIPDALPLVLPGQAYLTPRVRTARWDCRRDPPAGSACRPARLPCDCGSADLLSSEPRSGTEGR